MIRRFILLLPLALVFAATPVTVSIAAPDGATALSAAKKKPRAVRRAAEPAHVACTPAGCYPTPPGCRPERAMDWRGNPYEYDVVVCRR